LADKRTTLAMISRAPYAKLEPFNAQHGKNKRCNHSGCSAIQWRRRAAPQARKCSNCRRKAKGPEGPQALVDTIATNSSIRAVAIVDLAFATFTRLP
jgi:hypothetical protein